MLANSNRRKKSSRFAGTSFSSPNKSTPLTNSNSVQTSHHPHAVHHQPFLSSRSTPVSPEQQSPHHFSIAGRSTTGMSSMRVSKASTLKASPTSAFSTLSPAISLSEFSHHSAEGTLIGCRDARYGFIGGPSVRDRNDFYYAGHGPPASQYGNRHHFMSGGPLVKTRSEISLTNPSPPPSMNFMHGIPIGLNNGNNPAFPGRRRYPSPSRSQSQHFQVKPPTSLVLSTTNNNNSMMTQLQNHPPPQMKQLPTTHHVMQPPSMQSLQQQPPPKPKLSSSGYYSDSSSNDVWSLPTYVHHVTGGQVTQRTSSVLPNGVNPANSIERRESIPSHAVKFSSRDSVHQPLQPSIMTSSLPLQSQHPRTISKIYSSNGSSSASSSRPDRLRARSGSKSGDKVNGSVASSNLQHDLLKLISPETLNDGTLSINSGTDTVSTTQYSTPYSSLERSKINEDHYYDSSSSPLEVMAGQVPSTSSSRDPAVSRYPAAPVMKPPRSHSIPALDSSRLVHLTASKDPDMEWGSLVDTATRALGSSSSRDQQSVSSSVGDPVDVEDLDVEDDREKSPRTRKVSRRIEESLNWISDFANGSGSSSTAGSPNKTSTTTSSSSEVNGAGGLSSLPPESLKKLEAKVEKLQSDLHREQTTNANLEEEVTKLKEENQRLQEESQTAAAQLRKFTEWFFQNINAK